MPFLPFEAENATVNMCEVRALLYPNQNRHGIFKFSDFEKKFEKFHPIFF